MIRTSAVKKMKIVQREWILTVETVRFYLLMQIIEYNNFCILYNFMNTGEYSDYGDMDEDIGEEDDDHSWKVYKSL